MINDNELRISNTSYTNKDFPVIYREILGYATKLSAKWKPESSNESDPGIVLLKVLAGIADKLNYCADKYMLENEMPSCTQDESMRQLCEREGYDIKIIRADMTKPLPFEVPVTSTFLTSAKLATVILSPGLPRTFPFKGDDLKAETEGEVRSIIFPAYQTVVTDENNSVCYILTEDCELLDNERKTDIKY